MFIYLFIYLFQEKTCAFFYR